MLAFACVCSYRIHVGEAHRGKIPHLPWLSSPQDFHVPMAEDVEIAAIQATPNVPAAQVSPFVPDPKSPRLIGTATASGTVMDPVRPLTPLLSSQDLLRSPPSPSMLPSSTLLYGREEPLPPLHHHESSVSFLASPSAEMSQMLTDMSQMLVDSHLRSSAQLLDERNRQSGMFHRLSDTDPDRHYPYSQQHHHDYNHGHVDDTYSRQYEQDHGRVYPDQINGPAYDEHAYRAGMDHHRPLNRTPYVSESADPPNEEPDDEEYNRRNFPIQQPPPQVTLPMHVDDDETPLEFDSSASATAAVASIQATATAASSVAGALSTVHPQDTDTDHFAVSSQYSSQSAYGRTVVSYNARDAYESLQRIMHRAENRDTRTTDALAFLRANYTGVLENDWECMLERQVRMYARLDAYATACHNAAPIRTTQPFGKSGVRSSCIVQRLTFPKKTRKTLETDEDQPAYRTLLFGATNLVAGLVGVFQKPADAHAVSRVVHEGEPSIDRFLCSYPAFVFTHAEVNNMPFENNTQMNADEWLNTQVLSAVDAANKDKKLISIGVPYAPGVMFNDYRSPDGYAVPVRGTARTEPNAMLYTINPAHRPAWDLVGSSNNARSIFKLVSPSKHTSKNAPAIELQLYNHIVFAYAADPKIDEDEHEEEEDQQRTNVRRKKKRSDGTTGMGGGAAAISNSLVERVVSYGENKKDFFRGTKLLMQACHVCFRDEQAVENQLIKCTHRHCTRYYHQRCISYLPAAMPPNCRSGVCSYAFQTMKERMRWRCPLHFSNTKESPWFWAKLVRTLTVPPQHRLLRTIHAVAENKGQYGWIRIRDHMTHTRAQILRFAPRMVRSDFDGNGGVARMIKAVDCLFWAVSSGHATAPQPPRVDAMLEEHFCTNRTRMGLCLRARVHIKKGQWIDLEGEREGAAPPPTPAGATAASQNPFVKIGEACSPQQFGLHVFRWVHLAAESAVPAGGLGGSAAPPGAAPPGAAPPGAAPTSSDAHNVECVTWQETLTCDTGKAFYTPNPNHEFEHRTNRETYCIYVPCIVRATQDIPVGHALRLTNVVSNGEADAPTSSSAAATTTTAAAAAAAAASSSSPESREPRKLFMPRYLEPGQITYDTALEAALSSFYARVVSKDGHESRHRYYDRVIDMADALRSWPFLFDAVFPIPGIQWNDRVPNAAVTLADPVAFRTWTRSVVAWCNNNGDKISPLQFEASSDAAPSVATNPFAEDDAYSEPFYPA